MEESILRSIKKLLGIGADYTAFDQDVMMHINSVFAVMHQIGASPPDGFVITGNDETWSDFLADRKHLELVRSYMYLQVKVLFDPPTTSFALDSINRVGKEYEWRLSILENAFTNGNGGSTPGVGEAYIWDLTGLSDFPPEAPVGAIGVDLITGDVWRKN